MRDRTDEVQAIIKKYDAFEFVPLRIEDAFDASWWEKAGGSPIDYDLGAGFANEGTLPPIRKYESPTEMSL